MDDREYHQLARLSASGAKTLLKSPARYHHERMHPAKPTPAMEFGTMFHALVLEPDVFAARYALLPGIDRRTKDGKAAFEQWQADNVGKTPVTGDDWDRVHAMARAVERSGAGDLMTGGVMEQPILWERDGAQLKAKIDCLTKRVIIDLKSTSVEDEESLQRAAWQHGYHISAAAYIEAAKVATGNDLGKVFVFVHSTAPHDVIVLEAGEEFVARGRALWDRAVRTYAACVEFDDWPGMAAAFTSSQLQPPRWA
jgi:exodeoxyribonuclease VIII